MVVRDMMRSAQFWICFEATAYKVCLWIIMAYESNILSYLPYYFGCTDICGVWYDVRGNYTGA